MGKKTEQRDRERNIHNEGSMEETPDATSVVLTDVEGVC
jgi:hypothetical protein